MNSMTVFNWMPSEPKWRCPYPPLCIVTTTANILHLTAALLWKLVDFALYLCSPVDTREFYSLPLHFSGNSWIDFTSAILWKLVDFTLYLGTLVETRGFYTLPLHTFGNLWFLHFTSELLWKLMDFTHYLWTLVEALGFYTLSLNSCGNSWILRAASDWPTAKYSEKDYWKNVIQSSISELLQLQLTYNLPHPGKSTRV
jgi:hypothetical protein